MLKLDLHSLMREVEAAEDFRDQHLSEWRRLIERFHGPAYRAIDTHEDDPENFVHEYVALLLPRIVHDSPKIRVKSARPVTQSMTAGLLQVGINRWCKMTKVRNTLERIATDMLLGYGVGMVVNEPRKGYRDIDGGEPFLPRLYRISPDRFFMDPAATNVEDTRYMGHCWVIDRDDLLAQAEREDGWDSEIINRVADNSGVDEVREGYSGKREIPDRQELVVYEVFVPEVRDEDIEEIDESLGAQMFSGTIYTMIKGQSADGKKTDAGFARKPRPYYGPRTGPYTVFGVYTVPDDPYPLSPIMALVPQMDDVNHHLRSMRYSASAYKRLIAVDSRNAKLAQDIRDKDDLYVVLADGIDPTQVVPIEIGGITQQQVQYSSMAQDRLDRVSGIHDAMRGNITGQPTATEVSVAESASGMRMAHLKRQFQECVNESMRNVAWFLFHDRKVMFPIGEDGVAIVGEPEPLFSASAMVGTFDDLDLDIEAMSMERVSDIVLQKRSMEMLQLVSSLAQQVVVSPHVKWRDVMSLVGDAMNIPNLGDLIDHARVMQMQQGAGQSPQAGQGENPLAQILARNKGK
jgi:hypothetical protein